MRRALRHPDARRHLPAVERLGRHAGADALGHQGRGRHRRLEQHHQELLAAVAGDAIHRAGLLAQDVGDLDERRVPGGVALGVVVLLEVIDVRQQHRDRAPQAARPLRLGGQRTHQIAAIVQAGERVGHGEPLQLRLALPFPQPHHQRVEDVGQVPDLPAAAHREIDREVPGGDLRRRRGEALERAHDDQSQDVDQQRDACEQRHDRHHGVVPQPAELAGCFRPR